MIKQTKDNAHLYLGTISSSYFLLLWINYHFIRSINTELRVIQEMITLPLAIMHLIAFIIAVQKWNDENYRRHGATFWLLIIMILITALFLSPIRF